MESRIRSSVLGSSGFDEDDLEDMVRAALSKSEGSPYGKSLLG